MVPGPAFYMVAHFFCKTEPDLYLVRRKKTKFIFPEQVRVKHMVLGILPIKQNQFFNALNGQEPEFFIFPQESDHIEPPVVVDQFFRFNGIGLFPLLVRTMIGYPAGIAVQDGRNDGVNGLPVGRIIEIPGRIILEQALGLAGFRFQEDFFRKLLLLEHLLHLSYVLFPYHLPKLILLFLIKQ